MRLLMNDVGDNWIASVLFTPGIKPQDEAIFKTTWNELESKGYLRSRGRHYTMTGSGWRYGLELTDRRYDPLFKQQVGTLIAALKDTVKGRDKDFFPFPRAVAQDTGLPEGLIRNIIESNIIRYWLRRRGAELQHEGSIIRVPIDFGLELL